MTNKDLLYSTGHYTQYLVITYYGKNLKMKKKKIYIYIYSCCCYSFSNLCLTLCKPMNCHTNVFPNLHYPPKLAQIHVH